MKIVCESCGAKYSIADEKVAGKVFKIRCKRCSEVIIVRGDEQPAAEAYAPDAGQAYNYGADAIWHVVVDGEQAGPYAPAQLGEMLTQGTVDWEAYVWTEGFDNWVPMRDVEDLVAQITGEGQQAAEQQAYGSAGAATLAAQPSMGADPFADEPAPSEAGLFGDAGAASPDLFGTSGAEPVAAGGSPFDEQAAAAGAGVVASSPSPRVSEEQAMTGARNENSVLFSLKNLQALATGSSSGGVSTPPAAAPSTGGTAGAGGGSAGYASGEGSGLIDIRALASATGVSEGEGEGEKDELLSMGSQGGAFGSLGSPMLTPATADEGEGNKKALVWALVAGAAMLSIAGVAVAFILRSDGGDSPQAVAPVAATPPPATAAAAAANAEEQGDEQAAEPQGDEGGDEEPPSEGELAAKKAAEETNAKDDDDRDSAHRRRRKSSGGSRTASRKSNDDDRDSTPAKTASKDSSPEPSKPSGPRSIDDLLNSALSGKGGSKPRKAAAPTSNLPEQPTKSQVLSAMNKVRPAVQACAKGQSGVAFVNVSVAGKTGRVTNAQVSGVTGPAGSCIARAVRKARFPKFQQNVFKVKFPFKL